MFYLGCNPNHTFVGVSTIEHDWTYFGVDMVRIALLVDKTSE